MVVVAGRMRRSRIIGMMTTLMVPVEWLSQKAEKINCARF
jgi:hypothetical protein